VGPVAMDTRLEPDSAEEFYYNKYQGLKHGHKTQDPEFADHWGNHKKYILFPDHLPDLFTPLHHSFVETLPNHETAGVVERMIGETIGNWSIKFRKGVLWLLVVISLLAIAGITLAIRDAWKSGTLDLYTMVLGALWFGLLKLSLGIKNYLKLGQSWKNGPHPHWKYHNKESVFKPWIKGYRAHLEERGLYKKEFADAMSYLIHIYSMTAHKNNFGIAPTNFMLQWDGELEHEATKNQQLISTFEDRLDTLEPMLQDMIAKLDDIEKDLYYKFNNIQRPTNLEQEKLTSPVRYQEKLSKELLKGTDVVSNDVVEQNWRELLETPDFSSRDLLTDKKEEVKVSEFIDGLLSDVTNKQKKCYAIKAEAGQGKTTLVTQLAKSLLAQRECKMAPLIIKARKLQNIKSDGDLGLESIVAASGYYRFWTAAGKKLLIIDGVDENIQLHKDLCEKLYLSAKFYKAHIIITGRTNTNPSPEFQIFTLGDFSEDYLNRLIYASSEDQNIRKKLSKVLPMGLKQRPLSIFGSAEIISNEGNNFDQADVSSYALGGWMFDRICAESERKHSVAKEQLTRMGMSKALGLYAAGQLLDKRELKEKAEQMSGYKNATNWELIDSTTGIKESFLEGYFLVQAANNKDEMAEILLDAWEELYEENYERWVSFVRHYITSNNPLLPILVLNWRNDNEDDEIELEEVIEYSRQEWVRGNTKTRIRILNRLGLPDDENGRIALKTREDIPDEYQKPTLIHALMSFHCTTWESEHNFWNDLSDDKTWDVLANIIYETHAKSIVERARNIHKQTLITFNPTSLFRKDLKFNKKIKDEPFGEFLSLDNLQFSEQDLLDTLKQFFQPTDEVVPKYKNLNDYMKFYYERMYYFGCMETKILPLEITAPKVEKGFLSLPKPLMKFLLTSLQSVRDATSSNEQQGKLQMLYAFFQLANWGAGADLFSIEEDENLHQDFIKCHDNISDNQSKLILRMLYAFIRGHGPKQKHAQLLQNDKKLNPWIFSSTQVDFDADYALDTRNIRLDNFEQANKNKYLINLNRSKSLPYFGDLSPGEEEFEWLQVHEAVSLRFEWVSVRAKNIILLTYSETDNIVKQNVLYAERIYSPLPLNLMKSGSGFCFLFIDQSLISSRQLAWGILPWFQPLSSKLDSVINDEDTILQYRKLDLLASVLKQYGKTSSQEQAEKMGQSANLEIEYFGVSDLREGPDTQGYFYLNFLTGTSGNGIYITEESSGGAWDFFDEAHKKQGDYAIIYTKFKLKIEQNLSNNHCILVPQEIEKVCRCCFKSENEFTMPYPSLCEPCYKTLRGDGIVNLNRHLKLFDLAQIKISHDEKTVRFIERPPPTWIDSDKWKWKLEQFKDIISFYIPEMNQDKEWEIVFPVRRCIDCNKKSSQEDKQWPRQERNKSICSECFEQVIQSHDGPYGELVFDSIHKIYGPKRRHIESTAFDENLGELTIHFSDSVKIGKQQRKYCVELEKLISKEIKSNIRVDIIVNVNADDNNDGDDADGTNKKTQWHHDEGKVWGLEESMRNEEYKRRG